MTKKRKTNVKSQRPLIRFGMRSDEVVDILSHHYDAVDCNFKQHNIVVPSMGLKLSFDKDDRLVWIHHS